VVIETGLVGVLSGNTPKNSGLQQIYKVMTERERERERERDSQRVNTY